MLAKLRPHLTYANVMATIAVFLALGGSAYAVATVTGADVVDESLTGADVQGKAVAGTTPAVNGSLTTHDIAGQQANSPSGTPFIDGTLTQWDVKNSSLTGGDLASNTVAAADIATGGVGAPEIAPFSVGASDIVPSGVGWDELATTTVVVRTISVPPGGGVGGGIAPCPEPTQIITGGASFAFPSGDISSTVQTGNGWFGQGQNNGNLAQDLRVEARCLQAGAETP